MSAVLVFGGACSGKSRFAESLAQGEMHYVASAQAFDAEMKLRITTHQQQRGPGWITHEVPLDVVQALRALDQPGRFILFDCLTLWLSNLMFAERNVDLEMATFCDVLRGCRARVVVVSNEVGAGIVPDNALARAFRDAQGVANQRVAAAVQDVVMVAAGLPMVLKGRLPTAADI
jgi:adenosylcobinamide kinase / adenosylcobinamide-phosphate guanylyltransferase